ncbi:unnamed protein product [Rotaria sp. Silwood1]|nr:unnamed protein product [Rotaria sp. Silwood1]CAF1556648.1 unnamed protein product [Rotaria sp. Silwood1]CAF3643989.1 unnamed protein product [Rotaria sp. Silwood1]CAF4827732.1 unnamed protein product [Rotaria sp. Silwood1]
MAIHISYPTTPQFRQAVDDVNKYASLSPDNHDKQLPTLNFIGTVKLHGSNVAIGYQIESGYWYQSRNRLITPYDDYADFAQHMNSLAGQFFTAHVLPYCPTIREHYMSGDKVVIYGEWCGGNIQKHVAISGLPLMFVIFKVKIVNQSETTAHTADADNQEQEQKSVRAYWLDPKEWTNIKWHEYSIYNILDFPTYTIDIDFNNAELSQDILTKITEQVEQQCPVGTYFNRLGIGEGVVWTEWVQTRGNLTFKVKGRQHLVTQAKALVSVKVTRFADVGEFIEYACTENRMYQGLDYMREQNVSIEMNTMNIFLKWLREDICKEEKDTMNVSNISATKINEAIRKKAETWYKKKVANKRKRNKRKQKNYS